MPICFARAHCLSNGWVLPARPPCHFPTANTTIAYWQRPAPSQYRLLFSSDAVLNRCENGWIDGDLLGRIPVNMQGLSDKSGRLAPHKLAPWLFLRDIRAPIGAC